MNYPDSVRFLYALGNEVKTARLGLERIAQLFQQNANPLQPQLGGLDLVAQRVQEADGIGIIHQDFVGADLDRVAGLKSCGRRPRLPRPASTLQLSRGRYTLDISSHLTGPESCTEGTEMTQRSAGLLQVQRPGQQWLFHIPNMTWYR